MAETTPKRTVGTSAPQPLSCEQYRNMLSRSDYRTLFSRRFEIVEESNFRAAENMSFLRLRYVPNFPPIRTRICLMRTLCSYCAHR